jgi:hypothetical protein
MSCQKSRGYGRVLHLHVGTGITCTGGGQWGVGALDIGEIFQKIFCASSWSRMEGSFASRLRQLAVSNGYATLVDVVAKLVGTVSTAAAAGHWEAVAGPFQGAWHADEGETPGGWSRFCTH